VVTKTGFSFRRRRYVASKSDAGIVPEYEGGRGDEQSAPQPSCHRVTDSASTLSCPRNR